MGFLAIAFLIFFIITQPDAAADVAAEHRHHPARRRPSRIIDFVTQLVRSPVLAPREIDEYLLPTERRVIRVRQHWASCSSTCSRRLCSCSLMVVAQRLPRRAACSSTTSRSTWRWSRSLRFTVLTILWWIERIVITDKRVMLAEGIIVHKVGMMPLGKVTDLTFERTIGGRMLGYGTLIVESAGQIQALNRIDYMPRPEEVYEALSELVFGEKGKTRATGLLARPRWRR